MALEIKNLNPKDLFRNIKRSLYLLWETNRRLALLSFALQVIQALLPVVSLFFIKLIIEKVTDKLPFSDLLPFIIYFLATQLTFALVQQYAAHITAVYQPMITDHLSQKVLNKAISVDYAYYENPAYHDNLHLAQQQSLYKAGAILSNFNSFITSGFALLFLLLFFISMQSFFALLFIALSIPLALIKWYFGIATFQQERKLAPLEREALYLHQVLTGVSYAKETRLFGFGSFFIEKFANIRSYILLQKKSLNKRLTQYSLLAESIELIAMATIFAFLAKQAVTGFITLGLFVIYIQGFQGLQNNSRNFLQSIVQILQLRIFLQDLFTFLDLKMATKPDNQQPFPILNKGLIIDSLSFHYPGIAKPVLQNISLKCQPGQIVAIVGENGSGKSTLIKLLAKLYEAQSGTILFDETALNHITSESYQKKAVFLFQDFEKYFFTVEENITLGRPMAGKTDAEIQEAATLSGANRFITKLSKGYKTRMGGIFDGSTQLSGGEWQKLALSRVFYRDDAAMIVLDEPTSALDAGAEYEIFNQIKLLAGNKIVILITHRLYNLKIADYLYVMEHGTISESGTFDELVNKGGLFTRLYNMQQL